MYGTVIRLKDFIERKHLKWLMCAVLRLCDFIRRIEKVGG